MNDPDPIHILLEAIFKLEKTAITGTFLLGLLLPIPGLTDDSTQNRFNIHGFASQAYIHSTDNHFFGHSDSGSFDFTELGLNGSFQLSPRLRLAGQVLSRRAGVFDNGSPRVDYALMNISLFSNPQFSGGMYLGRIKNPIGLYNETRDVAHTREGIFLPQAIYFDKIRDLTISADGIQLYAHYYFDNDAILFRGGVGYPLVDKNVEYTLMGRDWSGDLKAETPGVFGRIRYEQEGGRWIYALTAVEAKLDFNARGSDLLAFPYGAGLSSGKIDINYLQLSAQFNGEKWQFTTEAVLEGVDYERISSDFDQNDADSLGFFVQANYRFTPQWQAFLRYEEFQKDIDDWNGKKSAQRSLTTSQILAKYGISQDPLPAHNFYSKAWVFGGRWLINHSLMLRAEYHIIDGTAVLSPRENDMAHAKQNWDLFSISLSYYF